MKYKEEYLRELYNVKEAFSGSRFRWLETLVASDNIRLDRLYISYGYVLAIKDENHYVGELPQILDMMIREEIN